MKVIFLNTKNLRNKKFNNFFSKSKYSNPIRNNWIQTKNTWTRPEVQKYPNRLYTSIPKYPKNRKPRPEPERVAEYLVNGSLPSSLSTLSGLRVLALANSRFNGDVPDWQTIQVLDLESNSLCFLSKNRFRDPQYHLNKWVLCISLIQHLDLSFNTKQTHRAQIFLATHSWCL